MLDIAGRRMIAASWLLVIGSIITIMTGCKTGDPVIAIESPQAALSPMMLGTGSVFMKILNTGTADDILLNAHAEISSSITELHDVQDGKMVKVENIRIPSASAIELRPGSLHIMIFKMPKDVKEGYEFSLVLNFKKSGARTLRLKLTSYASKHMH